jgi:prepilin-type N-terminal cleavage/methylation domain-containing protein
MRSFPHQSAFSLVELSIVLVILGLLTGGILGGQELIRAAELRAIPTELNKHRAAVYTFRDKYFALPGDMPNAVRFWGAAAGGTADGTDAACLALDDSSPSTGSETCNGDGDGRIELGSEMLRFWQHLTNAGLIEGQYTGVSATNLTNRAHQGGLNCPASKFGQNTAHSIYHMGSSNGSGYHFAGDYGNTFIFGRSSSMWETIGQILLPEDAWNIDTKLDDGKPGTGAVRPRNINASGHPNCSTSSDPALSEYNLTYDSAACGLHFITGL